jgi:flavin-dependent dehydrogenase
VQIMRGARVDTLTTTKCGDWRMEINGSGRSLGACARVLVDASGRRSTIARRLGAKRITMDRLIGCMAFFRPASSGTVAQRFMLIEAVSDGWWYSAPLPDERMVAVYMTDADLFAKLEGPLGWRHAELIARAPHTAKRLEHLHLDYGPNVFAANSSHLDRVWGDNWIAVGDSTMTLDPLSSKGVYRAMKSGLRAAEVIAESCSAGTAAHAAYAAEISSEIDRYVLQRQHYYSLEPRWSTQDFWRRRRAPGSK